MPTPLERVLSVTRLTYHQLTQDQPKPTESKSKESKPDLTNLYKEEQELIDSLLEITAMVPILNKRQLIKAQQQEIVLVSRPSKSEIEIIYRPENLPSTTFTISCDSENKPVAIRELSQIVSDTYILAGGGLIGCFRLQQKIKKCCLALTPYFANFKEEVDEVVPADQSKIESVERNLDFITKAQHIYHKMRATQHQARFYRYAQESWFYCRLESNNALEVFELANRTGQFSFYQPATPSPENSAHVLNQFTLAFDGKEKLISISCANGKHSNHRQTYSPQKINSSMPIWNSLQNLSQAEFRHPATVSATVK